MVHPLAKFSLALVCYSTFGRRSGWVDFDGDGDLDLHILAGHGTDNFTAIPMVHVTSNVASYFGIDFGTNGNASSWGDVWMEMEISMVFLPLVEVLKTC